MQPLQISKEGALAAYDQADGSGKALLEALFGKETFQLYRWGQIQSLDSAYAAIGLSPFDPRFLNGTPDDIAYQQLKLAIVPALNEGWVADYNDSNEEKWWPVFYLDEDGGGFRFDDAYCAYVLTDVSGGPRLALRSRERAIHAAQYFPEVFRNFYL